MAPVLGQLGRWAAAAAAVALVVSVITLRPVRDPADRSDPSTTPLPTPAATLRAVSGQAVAEPNSRPIGLAAPTRAPAPTPVPTPTAPPRQQTPAPVAANPPPSSGDDGAGGPIGPLRTAPPGWVPPTSAPGDVIVEGLVGQAATSGGITVAVTKIAAPTEGQRMCEIGQVGEGNLPAGYEWTGFLATTTWSGFSLDWPGGASSAELYPACYHGGYPFTSGATYEVWLAVPSGTGATAMLELGYFPNLSSPAYIFRFRQG